MVQHEQSQNEALGKEESVRMALYSKMKISLFALCVRRLITPLTSVDSRYILPSGHNKSKQNKSFKNAQEGGSFYGKGKSQGSYGGQNKKKKGVYIMLDECRKC